MSLSDERLHRVLLGWIYQEEKLKEAIKKLVKIGLAQTLYPKYIMLTKKDLDKIFGEKLTQ